MKLGRFACRAGALLVGFGLSAMPALAEVSDSQRTRVTDPAVLESMGFPRDAQNVYIANGLGASSAAPEDFGARDTWTTLPPKSFMPRENPANSMPYNGGVEGCCGNLTRLAGSDTFWDAPIYLPSGALLKDVRLYAADPDAAQDVASFLFERCQPEAGGSTTATVLASAATAGVGNQAVIGLVTPNVTVDNRQCHYMYRVNFLGTGTQTLQKIRIRWSRQVTAAPGAATFTDVPVGHPQHRFVEALVVAGVTGGCGPGLYCPDGLLTRGQMAVFLSVALGLSFQ